MAAGPFDFESKALINFLGALNGVKQVLATLLLQPTGIRIETYRSVNEFTMFFQQPLDAVIHPLPALFTCCECQYQIAIWLEVLALQSQQRRRESGCAVFIVGSPA